MVRFTLTTLFLTGLLASPAPGQTLVTSPSIPLKAPGSGFLQLQFQNSAISNWAGQIVNETSQIQGLIAAMPILPQLRPTLNQAAIVAIREAADVQKLALANARRDVMYRAHQQSDVANTNLVALIQRSGVVSRELAQAVSRLQYADQQLELAFANVHQGDSAAWRQRVAQLANVVSDQAGELRVIADESLNGFDRGLDRSIRSYSYGASGIEQNLNAGVTRDTIVVDVTELDRRWQTVAVSLQTAVHANPLVRTQASRVDALHRELVALVTGTAPAGNLPNWGLIQRGSAFAVSAGESGGPRVKIFFDAKGGQSTDFFAYDPAFRGGVRVAMADLTGDGIPDIIVAPGAGMMPLVRVFDGRTLKLLVEFLAYDQRMVSGVFVAAADLGKTGRAMIVTGADTGAAPHVRVFDLSNGKMIDEFFPYSKNFLGGVRVALGDVNGDGLPDIVTAPGPSQPNSEPLGPVVRVFDGRNRQVITEFNAYDPRWVNGVWIATGDITKNGRSEIFTGADAGGGPHVRVFQGNNGQPITELFPFPMQFNGGVRVAVHDVSGDGVLDFICAPGPSATVVAPPVRLFDGRNKKMIGEFRPFEATFRGGAYVGAK
jgi:hypothetical protein